MHQRISLIGRLGQDIEVKQSQSGLPIGNFSIAITEQFKKDEKWEEHTEWFRCTIFGKRAANLEQYMRKGGLVHVEGKIRQREYQGKYYTSVNVDNVHLLGDKSRPDRDVAKVEKDYKQEKRQERDMSVKETRQSFGGDGKDSINLDDVPF